MKKKRIIVYLVGIVGILLAVGAAYYLLMRPPVLSPEALGSLPRYTLASLAQYNGERSDLPILLALDGYVYDVTSGKEYYAPGAIYHELAGTDASTLLHAFGGDIIKRKYSIVGVLVGE